MNMISMLGGTGGTIIVLGLRVARFHLLPMNATYPSTIGF